MGLPLGVEYERKKQRLQHELRMDYRRYMAQVTDTDLPVYSCVAVAEGQFRLCSRSVNILFKYYIALNCTIRYVSLLQRSTEYMLTVMRVCAVWCLQSITET